MRRYDEVIRSLGVIDLQLLGLGHNGHIGFNEPGEAFEKETHCVALTESTIEANKRFFEREEDVPRFAYTMGIRSIMQAHSILLVVSGRTRRKSSKGLFRSGHAAGTPRPWLQLHNHVTLVGDEAALSLI